MLREGMIVTVHHDCGVVTGPYRIIEVQGDSHTEPSFSDAVEWVPMLQSPSLIIICYVEKSVRDTVSTGS